MEVNKKVVVVIPALNEKDTIVDVIRGVKRYVDEIIIVDDASTDETASLAQEQGAVVFCHDKTQGYDKSIDDGFVLAEKRGASVIVTFDADGQHNPEDIPIIIEPILKGEADVVVGKRPHYARITEYFFKIISEKRVGVKDPLCGLKSYRVEVYRDVGCFDKISSIGTQLMFDAKKRGYRVVERDIRINARTDHSRFGNKIRANRRILGAIARIIMRG